MTDGNSKFSVMVTIIFMLCGQILLPHYRPCNPEVLKGCDPDTLGYGQPDCICEQYMVINEGKDELGWDCFKIRKSTQ